MPKMISLLPYLKALCEEKRLRAISLLLESEKCICELMEELDLSQPAVSHHMKILKQAGLIRDRREGRWIFYALRKDKFSTLNKMLQELIFEPVKQSNCEKGSIPLGRCS